MSEFPLTVQSGIKEEPGQDVSVTEPVRPTRSQTHGITYLLPHVGQLLLQRRKYDGDGRIWTIWIWV